MIYANFESIVVPPKKRESSIKMGLKQKNIKIMLVAVLVTNCYVLMINLTSFSHMFTYLSLI